MENKEQIFCQSCGMPLSAEFFGTNADASMNHEYCTYCYKDGNFSSDVTMDEMIEHCLEYLEEFNKDANQQFTKEEARTEMHKFFPMLKRWQS